MGKLPPYAKALRAARDAGRHPWMAWVWFTRRWVRPQSPFEVMVPPEAFGTFEPYAPGMYDFRDLAGVAVHVVVDAGPPMPRGDKSPPRYLMLAIELAGHCAPVEIHLVGGDVEVQRSLHDALIDERWRTGARWPPGWSDQQQLDYERRAQRLEEFYAASQSRAAQPEKAA